MDLNFIQLIFTLKLEADTSNCYALFGMRPYFEEAFRQAASCGDDPCARGGDCPWHQTFAQPLSADPAALRRYQKPSLPFVFRIPLLPPTPNRGSTVEIGLVLTGTAVGFVTGFVAALEGMLRSPGFRQGVSASLMKVESAGYGGNRIPIMEPGREIATGLLATISLEGLRQSVVLPPGAVTVTIVTPMRLIVEGRPLREFSFSPFIRALLRRVSAMAYYHGGSESGLDYKWLAGQSRLVDCAAADLRWVEWGSKWSGLIGSATFTGGLTEYHPFLIAGEYLQVGKGATFGLGRYILEKAA